MFSPAPRVTNVIKAKHREKAAMILHGNVESFGLCRGLIWKGAKVLLGLGRCGGGLRERVLVTL
jgi:hypothetical protein